MPDPIAVLEELAGAAHDMAQVLAHFPEPGSAPTTAVTRVTKRMIAALEAHGRIKREVLHRLFGRR